MPNLGIALVIIGVTLFVIEPAQKIQERRRNQPIVAWIVGLLDSALDRFAVAADYDYTMTHCTNYQALSKPAPLAVLTRWRDELKTAESGFSPF